MRVIPDGKKRGKEMAVQELEPITANESEKPALNKMRGVLNNDKYVPKLVAPNGEEIVLPQSVFLVLRQIVYHMMRGRAIFIVPENKYLTTQQAAEMLNVSRPYVIKLLELKKIPFTKVGSHRRIRFSDLMNYKRSRDIEREHALDEIAQMSQDSGMYD